MKSAFVVLIISSLFCAACAMQNVLMLEIVGTCSAPATETTDCLHVDNSYELSVNLTLTGKVETVAKGALGVRPKGFASSWLLSWDHEEKVSIHVGLKNARGDDLNAQFEIDGLQTSWFYRDTERKTSTISHGEMDMFRCDDLSDPRCYFGTAMVVVDLFAFDTEDPLLAQN